MEFGILGTLEVRDDSGAVALRGMKQRTLLAMLLLHANQPVNADVLMMALWGEDAPADSANALRVNVSRLRKALGDGEGRLVAWTAAGYELRIDPDQLDAERFARLVTEGRRELAAGRPERAGTLLSDAITLWRGRPLGDLADEPFAATEIARLEEQRLAALEARLEADLAAGRHAVVVGDLAKLAAEHSTREGLAGLHMRALYRCGRQAEALEVYRRTRAVLVAEIGVEPGPELRRLHDAILQQDAALEPPAARPELPRELDLAAAPPLVARMAELAWLWDRWKPAQSGAGGVTTLTGPSGIGKTHVAAELAAEVHRLGGAVLYSAGTHSADAVISTIGRARGAPGPVLLVIDDAHRMDATVQTELAALPDALRARPVLALVCGEDGPALASVGGNERLRLDPLDLSAVRAIALLHAPAHDEAAVPAEALLAESAGIPRLVHQVATRWARREAARNVGAVAGRTAAGRMALRSMEAALAGGVEELQAVHDRAERERDDGPGVCPFKGLAPFDVADAEYFFGRERLVAELVARLVGAPLLAVVGPSGSGKSSVTRAGLLPALASGVVPGSDTWQQLIMRPGEHPAAELSATVARLDPGRRALAGGGSVRGDVHRLCRRGGAPRVHHRTRPRGGRPSRVVRRRSRSACGLLRPLRAVSRPLEAPRRQSRAGPADAGGGAAPCGRTARRARRPAGRADTHRRARACRRG